MDNGQHHFINPIATGSDKTFELLMKGLETIEDYAIFTLDSRGRIQNWNHGARRIKGYFPHEVLGKHVSLFYTQDQQRKLLPQYELQIAADRGRFDEEGWRVRKSGEKFWAHISLTVLKDSSGDVIGFTKVVRDLTDQKITEKEIRKIKEHSQELEDSIRIRDEFISVASHELRTPVTRILLNIQLMKRNGQNLSEKEVKSLDVCESATKELVTLMDNLVDVTRLRLGKLEIRRTKTNITNTILHMIDRFKDDIRFAGNHLSFSHSGDIIGYWDQNRLEQLFSNLLSNAIKYTEGKPIRMKLSLENEQVHFEISDEGPGIPYHLQPKVFERFERAADSKKISGLGLGLYVSKQIVDAHKGTISLRSRPGHGASFFITLPLKKESKKKN